ncbi:MAG TPA: SUMF1/EgtB/PvdO family nonheme iron enzyme [Spirochaetota bacterium]|nr:SUMF1/EgtB/PvdO family nonheme iron enzyme [Spirochaetota bacterium]
MKKYSLLLSLTVVLASMSVFPMYGSSQEQPSIYVRYLVAGRGVGRQEAERVSRQLERAVIQSGRYSVMSQSQVQTLMQNAEMQQVLGCDSESCMKQIMKTTQTEYLMYGEVTKDEGDYGVSVNLMHRRRGGSAQVVGAETLFTTTFSLKTLTLLSKVIVKKLHGELVSDEEQREIIGNADVGGLVQFTVSSVPGNATLYVSNARKGTTPKRLRYPEGNFSAVLKYPGYKDKSFTIDLPSQRSYTIQMDREQYTLRLSTGRGMPSGIEVYDGDAKIATLGNGAEAVQIDSGEHVLVFEKEGYVDKTVALNITGETAYRVTMQKASYPLTVKTSADPAEVYLNGRRMGRTPYTGTHYYGDYTVKVDRDGYIAEEKSFTLKKRTALDFRLQKQVFVPFRVTSTPPGAKVFFGGQYRGTAPGTFQWPEGEVSISAHGEHRSDEKMITLRKSGTVAVINFDLSNGPEIRGPIEKDNMLRRRYRPGQVKRMGGMDFVFVPGGYFMMGSPDGEGYDREHPRHKVYVSPFWMGKYEVTQAQYQAVMGTNPSNFTGDIRRPVEQVSWNDLVSFCEKFSAKHSVRARLPREAEWEYACRGGTTTRYYWGDNEDGNYCWYYGNSGNTTHPVGQKRPNAFGLYDMSGNVWEWCMDWYDEHYYRNSPEVNPAGPASGSFRVLRGGSWGVDVDGGRSASRGGCDPGGRNYFGGFRVVVPAVD